MTALLVSCKKTGTYMCIYVYLKKLETSLEVQWLRLHGSTEGVAGGIGAHIQSLVGEIISSMLFGKKKKRKCLDQNKNENAA